MAASAKRGESIVLVVFIPVILHDVGLGCLGAFRGDFNEAIKASIRILFELGLLWMIFKGATWARLTTSVLALLGGAIGAFSAAATGNIFIFVWSAWYLACFAAIQFSDSVRVFIKARKELPFSARS